MTTYKNTSNAKRGGLFVGKSHKEGGIPAIVTDTGQPIEVEGGEAIINKEATKKFWKELSEINQSAGNGVPIPPPSDFDQTIEKMEKGGVVSIAEKKQIYDKWKNLVNMSASQLEQYANSKDGKESGLSIEEAKELGISSGQESAQWIIKMKRTNWKKWTPEMWKWANKQISFISRMRGVKGDLINEKKRRTPKFKALLIWGHNPRTFKGENLFAKGGATPEEISEDRLKELYAKYDFDNFAKGGTTSTYKELYNKKYGYPQNESHSLEEISSDTGVSMKGLQAIYNKGIGAFKTNPESVRPNVTSKEQWAMARVYSAVMGGGASIVDANELKFANGGTTNQLLAPNGETSNLNATQYELVRTPEFKAWFGDWEKLILTKINDSGIDDISLKRLEDTVSKVVDKNGEPLVVWHTTDKDFSIFDIKKSKEGFFFSPQKERLDVYNKSKLNSFYLNIKNPSHELFQTNINTLKSKNYDGIMDYGHAKKINESLYEIIAFNPEQIKLADGTNITFDNSNPDIRFEQGGSIDKKDQVTMDIPLLTRTLELAREDIKSDEELHHVIENLIDLKDKPVLTMDDYREIVKTPSNQKYEQGGSIESKLTEDEILVLKSEIEKFATEFVQSKVAGKDLLAKEIEELKIQDEELGKQRAETSDYNLRDELFKQKLAVVDLIKVKQEKLSNINNELKALSNGGKVASFTDKTGIDYQNVPDFRNIKSGQIEFNQETILVDEVPSYIPFIDEKKFEYRGGVLDAIRVERDSYIVAFSDFKYTKEAEKSQIFILTLDQLVLTSMYYLTKLKALYQVEADRKNERSKENYQNISLEKRLAHYSQRGFYNALPQTIKKKYSEDEWNALRLDQKEELYPAYKKYNPERVKSDLNSNQMYRSFHDMYNAFVDPEALRYYLDKSKNRIKLGMGEVRVGSYASQEAFKYWEIFREMMKYKILDIEFQRGEQSETYKTALETSFGESNTNNSILSEFGVLVKRQNGDPISPSEINEIGLGLNRVYRTFGNLKDQFIKNNIKISHAGKKLIFGQKAVGVYIPSMGTIGVSAKHDEIQFNSTLAHEIAHFIDNKIGENFERRFMTDDFESLAGKIAFTFRDNMNKPKSKQTDYINATKECFARALQQFFVMEQYGDDVEIIYGYNNFIVPEKIANQEIFVSKEKFNEKIKPLILEFLQENRGFFLLEQPAEIEVKQDSTIDKQVEATIEQPIKPEANEISVDTENKETEKMENKEKSTTTPSVSRWDQVPVRWRNISAIKPITFSVNPYDANFLKIVEKILGNDPLRPVMSSIHFDEYGATVTDAHKLLHIAQKNSEFKGNYPTPISYKGALKSQTKEQTENYIKESKYPNYLAVIPAESTHTYEVDPFKLLQYCKVALEYANKTTYQVKFKFGEPDGIGFNVKFLIQIVESMMRMQKTDKIYAHFTLNNRAGLFTFTKDYSKTDTTYALIMPVMVNSAYEGTIQNIFGAEDLDLNTGLYAYYDFTDNEIHNADGSVALYRQNYGDTADLPASIISTFSKLIGKNNRVPIMDNFCVDSIGVRVDNLDSSIIYKNEYGLPNGIYYIQNGATVLSPNFEVNEYPRRMGLTPDKKLFTISTSAFKFYLEKCFISLGDDEMRPVMSATYLHYDLMELKMVSTNAHILSQFTLTEYLTSAPEKSFEINLAFSKELILFLSNVTTDTLTLYADDKNYEVIAGESKFLSKIEAGKYPNYKAVIPNFANKQISFNYKDIHACITNEIAKKFAKSIDVNIKELSIYNNDDKIFIAQTIYNQKTKEFEIVSNSEICETPIKFTENGIDPSAYKNFVLVMPIMTVNGNLFNFNYKTLSKSINILGKENVQMSYLELNKPYIATSDNLNFKTSDVYKPVKQLKSKSKTIDNDAPRFVEGELVEVVQGNDKMIKSLVGKKFLIHKAYWNMKQYPNQWVYALNTGTSNMPIAETNEIKKTTGEPDVITSKTPEVVFHKYKVGDEVTVNLGGRIWNNIMIEKLLGKSEYYVDIMGYKSITENLILGLTKDIKQLDEPTPAPEPTPEPTPAKNEQADYKSALDGAKALLKYADSPKEKADIQSYIKGLEVILK